MTPDAVTHHAQLRAAALAFWAPTTDRTEADDE